MADYLAALTKILRSHVRTIDTREASGRAEWGAYTELADAYADLADRLGTTAARMRGYRDLPAAPHHEEELADPELMEVFARFVEVEVELAGSLQQCAKQDAELLRSFERSDS